MLLTLEGFDNSRLPFGYSVTGAYYGVEFTTGRTAGSSAVYMRTVMGAGNEIHLTIPVPNLAAFSIGLAMHHNATSSGTAQFIRLRNGATTHVALRLNAAGAVEVVNGAGAVLATSTVAGITQANVWHHWTVSAVIHDTDGAVKVELNGDTVIDVTGVDTRNGATDVVTSVGAGWFQYATTNQVRIDDVYLTDTTGPAPYNGSLGDCRVATLRPSGNGEVTTFVGSDGDSIDNWAHVDDNATTTDYVGSATPGARDLYALGNLSADALGDVYAVQVEMLAAKSDAGEAPGPLLAALRGVTGTVSTAQAAAAAQLSTTYQWHAAPIVTADPAGDAWTVERVDGLQIGPEIGTP